MTLFRPEFEYGDVIHEITRQYECNERATEEIMQYARTLKARGTSLEMLISMVGRYARIRGNSDAFEQA